MNKTTGRFILSLALLGAAFMPASALADETAGSAANNISQHNPLAASISWLQGSAEYKALCYQTYNLAAASIDEQARLGGYTKIDGRLCDAVTSIDSEGRCTVSYKPLAIVLDIDETVINNSGCEVWCMRNGVGYNPEVWDAWCAFQGEVPSACREVPGAVKFLKHCHDLGITPIYLTNRDESARQATLKALENLGLGVPDLDKHLILLDKSRDTASAQKMAGNSKELLAKRISANRSDKAGRRTEVRLDYKVIGWFGDNLYDMPVYVSSSSAKGEETLKLRDEQVAQNRFRFGASFFVLPNPIYGSWLGKETVPSGDMSSFDDDFGFGAWYAKYKDQVKTHSGR